MTLLELFKLLRLHVKRIVIVTVACTALCFAGALALSIVKPSYTATATLVASGGSFTSVSGLADAQATAASKDGVTVSSTASTTSNTVTLTAKGSSAEAVVETANTVVATLDQAAKEQNVATSTSVSEAEEATKTGKNPVLYAAVGFMGGLFCVVAFYVLADTMRGGVHAPEAVEERGLTYLGTLSEDEARMRIVMANLRFSHKVEGGIAKIVLLQPTSSQVRIRDAYNLMAAPAAEAGVKISAAPALEDSVYTLYKGREADSVVVVVEEDVTTFDQVDELVREFKIAGIKAGGFVYLPYNV